MKMKSRRSLISNHSNVFGVGLGIVISLLVSILLLAGVTSLLISGSLTEESTKALVFVIRAIALLAGVLVGTAYVKEKYIVFAGIITLGYLVLIAGLGIVMYNGSFVGFGSSAISVLIGGAAGCLIRLKLQNKPHRAKRMKP